MGRAVLLIALALAGCATAPPLGAPAVSAPDLRGSWTGTWGGEPFRLLLTEQTAGPGQSSVMFGPWPLFGERYPTVAGVMTSTIRGEPISANAQGVLGQTGARLLLTLRASSSAGEQRVTLRLVDRDRLQGSGDSQYRWGPQGAAELTRASR
jgi:hypothetical protein